MKILVGLMLCAPLAYAQSGQLAPLAQSGSASDLQTGTVPVAQLGNTLGAIGNQNVNYVLAGSVGNGLMSPRLLSGFDLPDASPTSRGGVYLPSGASSSTLAKSATTDTTNAANITSGTLPHAQLPTLLSADIPNNAANTTGNAAKAAALIEGLVTPASSTATCTAGTFIFDASFLYLCTATNNYKRVALAAF